jgi:hypothetical protein
VIREQSSLLRALIFYSGELVVRLGNASYCVAYSYSDTQLCRRSYRYERIQNRVPFRGTAGYSERETAGATRARVSRFLNGFVWIRAARVFGFS